MTPSLDLRIEVKSRKGRASRSELEAMGMGFAPSEAEIGREVSGTMNTYHC